MKAVWPQSVTMQYTHHALCLWHFWVGEEGTGMSHHLGGPLRPASLGVTCEAADASFISLCTVFSPWWPSIQILPFFPVEGE